ncbi:MAG: ATP-dependent helicase RecG, partial [Acidimicrobiaceae bacterium]
RIGILHGRLPADEKDAVMREFGAGRLDVLVATTVIEVGVDVPNATVMVILDADRFGLAQLHQLRGRVGRGAGLKSHCFLVGAGATPEAD